MISIFSSSYIYLFLVFIFIDVFIIYKFLLVDLNEESTTYRFETALLITAVKNFGQYIIL